MNGTSGLVASGLVSTGISELDQRIGGVSPGRYYLLTGTPGAGKTSACMHFLAEGLRAGEVCAILTQENPDDLFFSVFRLLHVELLWVGNSTSKWLESARTLQCKSRATRPARYSGCMDFDFTRSAGFLISL